MEERFARDRASVANACSVECSAVAAASRVLTDRMTSAANNPGTVRRTIFVAFRQLAIDELY